MSGGPPITVRVLPPVPPRIELTIQRYDNRLGLTVPLSLFVQKSEAETLLTQLQQALAHPGVA